MSENTNIQAQLKKYPSLLPRYLIEAIGIGFVWYVGNKTIVASSINERGLTIAKAALKGLLHPSTALIFNTTSIGLPHMLLETLAIAFVGTVFGVIFALPIAFLCSRKYAPKWVNALFLTIISIIRAFPSFMYAIMFVKVVGTGAFAGILTMAIGSIGMVSKLLLESIEDLNPGIIEAMDAAGCNVFEKIRYGIIPQLSSNIVSTIVYRLDINVKNATVLGLVGAGGIGSALNQAIGRGDWTNVSAMLLGLVCMAIILEYFSTRMRKKLAQGQ